jgi:hypothetical protein
MKVSRGSRRSCRFSTLYKRGRSRAKTGFHHNELVVGSSMVLPKYVVVLLGMVPFIAAREPVANSSSGEKAACSKLKLKYPGNTFLPGTSGYEYETHDRKYWTNDNTSLC